jgi:hypothetical protein
LLGGYTVISGAIELYYSHLSFPDISCSSETEVTAASSLVTT